MRKLITYYLLGLFAPTFLIACADDLAVEVESHQQSPISVSGQIEQDYITRANDDGFAHGDRMGVYIVDYVNGNPGTLEASGNRANNAIYEYDYDASTWSCSTTFYWRDDKTSVDVYGVYPYQNGITDINAHPFIVESDQSVAGSEGMLGGYEKSDFLWAKAAGAKPSDGIIRLTYNHKMAGVKVTLEKGDGITDVEWDKVEKLVTVDNTVRYAKIDISTGVVTADGKIDKNIVMAPQGGDTWRAVVVPQTIAAGTRFLGVTIDGTSYNYTRTQELVLTAGKLHKFTLKIDKKDGGDYTLSLTDEEVTPWENENISHGFFNYEYTIVRTTEPGTLKATIEAMGKDYTQIKNLKIIGPITESDFFFMRDEMSVLAMLNMKEAILKGWTWYEWDQPREEPDNKIPNNSFYGNHTLRRVVLPDGTEIIGDNAFREINLDVNSSIIIPPHVKHIGAAAFAFIGEAGELVLNDSLEYVGGLAFAATAFTCELNLPNSLKYIGDHSFGYRNSSSKIKNTGKHFMLPDNLEYLGEGAFSGIHYDEVGELIIPKCMTEIPRQTFPEFSRGIKITFHDGVKVIKGAAFVGQRFINHVIFPEGLMEIGEDAFYCGTFKAGLTLPSTLRKLGRGVFLETNEVGDVEIPEGILIIPSGCFSRCGLKHCILPNSCEVIEEDAFPCEVQSIKIGKYCNFIGNGAFGGELRSLIILNPEPPVLDGDPFRGCNLDQLILEVPEQSVELYRNTPGWDKVRFITAYHELAVGTSELICLDKGLSYETLVRAEGEWEVTECPDWCHVNPSWSEDRRTEVTITVDPTTPGSARDGKIVYKLKNADYTTYTTIHQLAYDEAEDKEIVFHTASADGEEIPVFIVGEGFDAKSIADGTYMRIMEEACEHLFAIEPFKTYKDYFTVSTAIAVSPDAGIETVTDIRHTKFGLSMDDFGLHFNFAKTKDYAKVVSDHITDTNVSKSLIITVPNFNAFLGLTKIDNDGTSMALCGYCQDTYPYDFRGLVQHYAGGAAFARLGNEFINHNTFVKACSCPGCNGLAGFYDAKAKGWYANLNLRGGLNAVPWSHLIFDPRYADIVDVYEGGYNHLRGVYRSENMSVMSNYIQYFNTYSRELIVRRIMELAGKPFDFEAFVAKDSREGIPTE